MDTQLIDSKDTNTTNGNVKVASKRTASKATPAAKAAPVKAAAKATATKTTARKTAATSKAAASTSATKATTTKTAAKTTTQKAATKPAAVTVEVATNLAVTNAEVAEVVVEGNKPGNAQVVAKTLWFAGLGVYGYSYDRLMKRKAQVSEKGQQVFDALLERGEELQQDTETVLADVKNKTTQQMDDAKERFSSLTSPMRPLCKLSEISNKLDTLNETLEDKVKKAA